MAEIVNKTSGKALVPGAVSSPKKVGNPMKKRLFRELKKDWKKYFVLFLLMVFMIGLASGIDVGNDSMMAAIDESYEKYTIENGHFELREKASPALLSMIENEDITVYEQFYKDLSESKTAPNEMKSTSDIDELLNTLGLWEHRYKLPNQLSGGQQQRTSIGRAIVKNPDILLCDEPTGALDYNTSKEILKLIEDVNQKYGNTVIMVTHNNAISDMADHTIKLRDGKVRKNIINENKISAVDLDW